MASQTLVDVFVRNDPGVVVTSIAIILFLVSARFFYNAFLHPLSGYPGPKLRAISRIPYLVTMLNGNHHLIIKDLHDQYGSVVRIAPDKLSYITAAAWKDIYGHKAAGQPEMPKDRQFYAPNPHAESILVSNRDNHSRFRRLLSHGFSDKSLREQESLIKQYVDMLIQGLHRRCSGEGPSQKIDLVEWYNWTTFDIIGDLTFGESFGCLENAVMHPWVKAIFGSVRGALVIRVMQHIPGASTVYPYLLPKRVLAERKAHLAMTKEKVQKRLEYTAERPDFMSYILQRPKERTMTFPELLSNSNILMVAGSETTATLLSGATFLLLKNPDKLAQLEDEILAAFNTEDEITIQAVSGLKYLHACLEESLRVYPPVPVGLHRTVPPGGSWIDGKFVPAYTSVTVSQLAAYHSAQNFKDPDSFLPERWLGEAQFEDDSKGVLQPFSVGPRNCIGQNLAYAEMRLIMARMIFNFKIELRDESQFWSDQLTYTLWEKHPLFVTMRPRTNSAGS